MIKSVEIENFQSHKHSKLELSPGLNVITGVSNSGKTAVIRALIWAIKNRPSGGSFITHGESDCGVTVTLTPVKDGDPDIIVLRDRFKSDNIYAVLRGADDTEPLKFEAFGRTVPQEVQDVLNLTNVNIQSQLDSHFLILDPPGKVAQYINALVGLDEVDSIITAMNSDYRAGSSDFKRKQLSLEDLQKKIAEKTQFDFAWFEKQILRGESLQENIRDLVLKGDRLRDVAENIRSLQEKAVNLPEGIEDTLSSVADSIKTFEELSSQIQILSRLVSSVEELSRISIDLPDDLEDLIAQAESHVKKIDQLHRSIDELARQIRMCESKELDTSHRVAIDSCLAERGKLYKELAQCPLCGQCLDFNAKERLLKNVC